jgi:Zn-dependent protease with chaperone function
LSALALPVVVLALMAGAAWSLSALIFPAWTALTRRWPALARVTPLVASLPALGALLLALAALLPGDPHLAQPFGCHCDVSMPGWAHLCPVHPQHAGSLVPLALLALAAWLPARLGAARALLREPLGLGWSSASPQRATLPQPTAMLVGWLRPTLFVDPRFWSALTEDERAAVLAHERGHLARRDPMVLMGLRALTALGPARAGDALARAWLAHAEARADALAAREVGDPVLVAEALLRCARLAPRPAPVPTIGWTGGALERRVRLLLADAGGPVSSAPDVGWPDLLVIAALIAWAAGSTPWVHHQVEHLLNLSL